MADSKEAAPRDASLRRFAELLSLPEEHSSLFDQALLLTGIARPELREGWWLPWEAAFTQLAHQVRDDLGAIRGQGDDVLLRAYADCFARTLRFRGPPTDYFAAANSSVAHCLERRTGLPITLSIIFAELGRAALGLDLFGVGTPGHFIAGARVGDSFRFVDPFSGRGQVLTPEQAAAAVAERTGRPPDSVIPHLRPASRREIFARMLNNLRNAFELTGEFAALARTLEWTLVLEPENREAQRDRGLALLRSGDLHRGATQLLAYVTHFPESADAETIRREAQRALSTRHSLN
ncbi:hypothetical protein GC173_01385 [bacterium]|nr:hypothetical protein [bacterium]